MNGQTVARCKLLSAIGVYFLRPKLRWPFPLAALFAYIFIMCGNTRMNERWPLTANQFVRLNDEGGSAK